MQGSSVSGTAQRAAILVVATLALIPAASVNGGTMQRGKRVAHSDEAAESAVKICDSGDPCGWALFKPFTRRVDYFVENTCRCASGMECRNTDTDKYLNAYVYRCTRASRLQTPPVAPQRQQQPPPRRT